MPAVRFAFVGVLASLVHLTVGTGLIHMNLAPLVANIFGFLAAFSASFLGHHHFSFEGRGNRPSETLVRFIWVVATGFGINEVVLASLLYFFQSHAMTALIVSTLTAVVATFNISHLWDFRRQTASN